MYYPRYTYSAREDITQKLQRDFDRKRDAIYKKCLEICPNYHDLTLREQVQLSDDVRDSMSWEVFLHG